MPGSSNPNHIEKFVTGQIDDTRHLESQKPSFVRFVILEVIHDPTKITDEKKDYWANVLKVSNMQWVDMLPRNTVITQELRDKKSPIFAFPFFPSHISFPSKVGEFVWGMYENPSGTDTSIAYWLCKIVQPHFVDDVNYTHAPRVFEPSYFAGHKQKISTDGKLDPWHELRNGPVHLLGEKDPKSRTTVIQSRFIPSDDEHIFEKLTKQTDGAKLMQYEAVPRFKKRPGDVVLEGSNNSLIVLGTDRTGPPGVDDPAASSQDQDKSVQPKLPDTDLQKDAGSIDMVVGRGQLKRTFGKEVAVTQMQDADPKNRGSELHKELGKVQDDLVPNEGDPDFSNDRSRILVSQRTKVDTNFGISDYNTHNFNAGNSTVSDSKNGDAAVVIKTDKIRLIARSDVEILVTNFTQTKSVTSQDIMADNQDTSGWASIVVKANGDIVFKPADKGVIKLGGDDADLAVLCVKSPNAATPDGSVKGVPIADTLGAQNGVEGVEASGQWAKKILVK